LEDNQNFGAVFTKRWVVDLMLNTCGYTSEIDLAKKCAVEPSCGDGAFLLPMVERLSKSLRMHNRSLSDATHTLCAFDLQHQHVVHCREAIAEYLVNEGWDAKESKKVVHGWVRHADYLLESHSQVADFVIGNPPYIRSENMAWEIRAEYMVKNRTMTTGADIFVGFIETGLRSLKEDGVLSYICADRWMHNVYGKKLRRLVVDGYAVEAIYEMHGVDAFAEQVSAYPAITQIRNAEQREVFYANCRDSFSGKSAARLFKWNQTKAMNPKKDKDFSATRLPDWFDTDSLWPSASPDRLVLLELLEERLPTLESATTGTKVGIGIATGADKVFVVHDRSVAEDERLVPLVATTHVRSGETKWDGSWLLNPWNDDGSLVALADYPLMAEYLEQHRESLSHRHIAKNSDNEAWFRTIDKVHPKLQQKPKLLLQDMKATITPVLDKGKYYPHHNLYWITTEQWDIEVLGGLLLSEVAEMFVRAYGVKMRGGTLRFQAQYLRRIRVPEPDSIAPDIAARLVHAFRTRDADEATQAALVAYGLDELPD